VTRRLVALSLAVLLAACGGATGTPPPSGGPLPVVATTTVLAEIVGRVGREHITVTSLVPKGGEVHTFDPSPRDVGRVEEARLIVANGLGLDDWLAQLGRDAGTGAPIVALGDALAGGDLIVENGRPNPHAWLDPNLAAAYGRTAAAALGRVDPANDADYRANAEELAAELAALDDDLLERLDQVAPQNRKVVSFHDALPYFARAFDLEVVGTIVSAPGQDPSAGELAALIDTIRASGARAILSEVQFSDELAGTIAEETGATVVSDLYTDSLGDPPVDTLAGMLRHDVDRIVDALR
jgi:manganese/iron transport system substrate-binding protein